MALPFIGLTTSRSANSEEIPIISTTAAYVKAILRAGGLPVLIPVGLAQIQAKEVISHLQGLLFTGGGDIDPSLFAGELHPRVYGIDPLRDELELSLTRAAVEEGLPFFGICRGIQVINVALGGKLFTDLSDQHPSEIKHNMHPEFSYDHITHTVEIRPDSHLASVVNALSLSVNSLHHQGISSVAPSLQPVAFSPDGLVEAVELPHHPFGLGVQWHPEWLPDSAPMQAIFRNFITAAGQRVITEHY